MRRMTSPEQLSPVPVPSPSPSPLPFGLTWEAVAGALPDLVGSLPDRGGDRTVYVSHVKRGEHQGGHPSVIMTLGGVGVDGRRRERTLFFKCNSTGSREADRSGSSPGAGSQCRK